MEILKYNKDNKVLFVYLISKQNNHKSLSFILDINFETFPYIYLSSIRMTCVYFRERYPIYK